MKRLEDFRLGQRIMLTVAIVIIILLLLAAFGYLTGRWDQADAQYRVQSAMPGLPTTKWDSRMFALDRDAADQAYTEQIKHLILTAIKAGDSQAFDRAIVGARNTRKSYIAVMEAIDKREREAEEKK